MLYFTLRLNYRQGIWIYLIEINATKGLCKIKNTVNTSVYNKTFIV